MIGGTGDEYHLIVFFVFVPLYFVASVSLSFSLVWENMMVVMLFLCIFFIFFVSGPFNYELLMQRNCCVCCIKRF